jgi:hypothetical protein
MDESVALTIVLFSGIGGIVVALLVKAGIVRKWPQRYFAAEAAPIYVRNGVFGLIPLSLGMLFMAAAVAVPNVLALPLLAVVLAFGSWGIAIHWIRQPPEWLKPNWMRRAESADGLQTIGLSKTRWIELSPLEYWATWVAIAAVFGLWLILGWPASTLIGIGLGLVFLAASRPDRRKRRARRY